MRSISTSPCPLRKSHTLTKVASLWMSQRVPLTMFCSAFETIGTDTCPSDWGNEVPHRSLRWQNKEKWYKLKTKAIKATKSNPWTPLAVMSSSPYDFCTVSLLDLSCCSCAHTVSLNNNAPFPVSDTVQFGTVCMFLCFQCQKGTK